MTTGLGKDLNDTIIAAVNAKVTAEVFAALNTDEVMAGFITQAMMQPVKVEQYGSKTEPYLTVVIRKAIQEATKAAINEWMADNEGVLKARVRETLSTQVEEMAGALVQGAIENTSARYSTKVDVKFQKERD